MTSRLIFSLVTKLGFKGAKFWILHCILRWVKLLASAVVMDIVVRLGVFDDQGSGGIV